MNVGILGATGFVGTNLQKYLTTRKITNIGASRKLGLDITNTQALIQWISDNRITHLINLAAECGGIGLNRKRPADLWLASTLINSSVLEAARQTSILKLILIGTVCSYAKNCPVPFKEEYLLSYGEPEPTNLSYGIAKLNALYGAKAYSTQYNMNICNLIPVNMYGPHDHFDLENSHVIPAIIRKIADAKTNNTDLHLWGTGEATREFLYVTDFCEAILSAILYLNEPTFVNIGTGKEISIKTLATTIAEIMGYTHQIHWNQDMPDGQPRRCLDTTKAKELLHFESKTDLLTGLYTTIQWYNNEIIRADHS